MTFFSYRNPQIKRCKTTSLSQNKRIDSQNAKNTQPENFSDLEISTFYSDIHFLHQFVLVKRENNVLYGDNVSVHLHDEWEEDVFVPGMRIRIIECRCCCPSKNCNENELMKNEMKIEESNNYLDTKEKGNATSIKFVKNNQKSISYTITNNNRYFVLIETPTLSVTNLITGLSCPLMPLLNERIENINFSYENKAMIMGKIFHELLQENHDFDQLLNRYSLELYSANLTENEAKKLIYNELPKIYSFRNKIKGKNEEYIQSSILQLKGIIDIIDNGIIEIKTGGFYTKDIAQVLLYYLISGIDPLHIYYLKSDTFHNVKLNHFDIVNVLVQKNRIAYVYFQWNSLELINYQIAQNDSSKIHRKSIEMQEIDDISLSDSDINIEKENLLDNFPILQKYAKNIHSRCTCKYHTFCTVINTILKIKGLKGDFLRTMLQNIINEEFYEQNKKMLKVKCIFIEQNDRMLTILPVTEDLNQKITERGYINIYDETVLISTAQILQYNNTLKCKLTNFYDFKLKNIFIEEKCNNLMLKNMWYSLVNIAFQSHLLDDERIKKFQNRILEKNNKLILEKQEEKCDENAQFNNLIDLSLESTETKNVKPEKGCSIPSILMDDFVKLNKNQQKALLYCLNTNEFCTIHGMPGTGKSKVISLLIQILLFHKKSVLLVCYTNRSILNITERIKYEFHKAGSSKQRVSEQDIFDIKNKTVKEWKESFSQNFVASTCYNFKDPIFKDRIFDYLIIDEATQQHLLLSLIPISISRKFILVGDPLQLYPLSKSFRGMSLLEFLGVSSVLTTQYRMKKNIMKISNKMFYDDRMECGIKGNGIIALIDISKYEKKHKLHKNVNKLNSITNIYNQLISTIHIHKLACIINQYYDNECIILCYFNITTEIIRKIDEKYNVSTIDRYQGCESKNVILLLFPFLDNHILRSKERLNVALTRAKNKLIIVGEIDQLKKIELFKECFDIIEKRQR